MSGRRYRILAVDDDPDVLDVLQRALEDEYDVVLATSGEQALEVLQQGQQIDLLITDQRMPEMSGIHLLEKAKDINPNMVRIILTGYTDPEDLIDAINRGEVFRYLTKPWDLNDLLLTIRQGLENYQLRLDKERLVAELRSRLRWSEVFLDVGKQATGSRSYEEVVKAVMQRLPDLVQFDGGAALVVQEGMGATLLLHSCRPLREQQLRSLRDRALELFFQQTGQRIDERALSVHVSGEQIGSPEGSAHFSSWVHHPLFLDEKPAGMLLLAAREAEAFPPDTSDLLDVLANQTASLIQTLKRQMQAERQRLELMVESLADGVIMVDDQDRVFVINPAARRLLRLPPDVPVSTRYLREVLGFYPFDLVRGWQVRERSMLREEIQVGDSVLHSLVSPVIQGSRLVGVAVVLRDITEERKLAERKEEFVSIVSHELRTPLTSIGGALDLLLNGFAGPLNEKQERYLNLAKGGCEKLNLIIDELLDLRRLEQGRMKMDMRPMDLALLVSDAVESYQAAAQERGVHLELRSTEQAQLLGDRNRLHQVLNNLLSNALKFTGPGNHIRVELISSEEFPGIIAVSVFNDGEEIPEEDHDRIFDKFEQARRSRLGKVSGSGLGLSICRSIVTAHGGSIWVESGRGEGTRFIFTLPASGGQGDARPDGEVPEGPATRFKSPPRLLIVDDDPAITYVLKGFLISCGYRVHLANRARQALNLARERQPDLIILDIRMPELDGLELTDLIRHDPATREIPILAVSAPESEGEAYRAGVTAFLPKPIDLRRLHQALERLLSERTSQARQYRVLIVDDDPSIRSICREVMQSQGFSTLEAASGQEALDMVEKHQVDAILLDLMLPDFDGFQVTEHIRARRQSANVPIIFISARGHTANKVRALKLGADDYVVKPFDAMELGARVEAVIQRKEREIDSSPTTKLPGSVALQKELNRRIGSGGRFFLCYLDLDNLKAYNDYYGYARADGVIQQTASLIAKAVEKHGNADDFVAHIAGDDFVLVTTPERLDAIAENIISSFDRLIPLFYDPDDQRRGYIEAADRFGTTRRFGIMTISLAAVLVEPGRFKSHAQISERAAALKMEAKKTPRSILVKDAGGEGAMNG